MTKKKSQVFLRPLAQSIVDRLCARYDWTAGQVIERLAFYYAATQRLSAQLDVDLYDERWGGSPFDGVDEHGQDCFLGCVVYSDPEGLEPPEVVTTEIDLVDLVEVVKEGLTPVDGFGSVLEEEQ